MHLAYRRATDGSDVLYHIYIMRTIVRMQNGYQIVGNNYGKNRERYHTVFDRPNM